MKFTYLLFALVLLIYNTPVSQAQLSYSIGINSSPWNAVIGNTSIAGNVTAAGMDYLSSHFIESASDHVKLDVELFLLLGAVNVSVKRNDILPWPNDLKLSVKRNPGGSGICAVCGIYDGLTYVQVDNNTTKYLFKITSVLSLFKITNIPIQYKLSGASVTMSGQSYQSIITYTISD